MTDDSKDLNPELSASLAALRKNDPVDVEIKTPEVKMPEIKEPTENPTTTEVELVQDQPAPIATPIVQVEPVRYQHYHSARDSMKMITHKGKKIAFTKHQYMTTDPEIIEYLNSEIAQGLNVITKGALLSHEESNPMEILKKQHIAEYLAKQKTDAADLALGKVRDMGETEGGGNKLLSPASSKTVVQASGSSSSGAPAV